RTRRGLSVAVLGAATAREHAATWDSAADLFGRAEVAPATLYGVAAVQQEIGRDRSTLGASLTGVRRDLDPESPLRALLPEAALSGIVDGRWRWNGGQYDVSAYAAYSHVAGDSLAILRLQRSPRRYYQRPDAGHVEVDPSRTALGGAMLAIGHSRMSGRWLWDVDYTEQRPGLELNDLGRLGSADNRFLSGNLRYRQTQPGRLFRGYTLGVLQEGTWNLDGVMNALALGTFGGVQLHNFWSVDVEAFRGMRAQSDNLTRGGPLMQTPAFTQLNAVVAGNPARRTRWRLDTQLLRDEDGGWRTRLEGNLSFRPGPRWELSVDPLWSREVTSRQYVRDMDGGTQATYGRRYVFAYVERGEVRARIRLNYAVSPDLTLETYAEPFASSGRFHSFGELRAARGRDLRTYGDEGTTITRDEATGERTVTDGAASFTLRNQDFDVRSFRSNAVLRWEWRPGSTLFVVWQQDRARDEPRWARLTPADMFGSLTARGDNFLALKVTYWLPVD
ncbi:MAG TPA: DUF5916 domain-containing protein, partial [Longimicrobium sp.]|nr:DUF5916 domain-containing protein [Longimicrobium sp.]